MWVQSSEPWLDIERWKQCGGAVDWSEFEGRTCVCGVDLSSNKDMTAAVLCFPPTDDSGIHFYLGHCWLPGANIVERSRKDGMPYMDWVKSGHLSLCDGDTIDLAMVSQWIIEAAKLYDMQELNYDRFGAEQMMIRLRNDNGINVVPVIQGPLSLNDCTRAFDSQVSDMKMRHGDDPIGRVQASRVVTRSDTNGNIMPAKTDGKKKGGRRHKVDWVVAAILALHGVMQSVNGSSVYEERGMLIL